MPNQPVTFAESMSKVLQDITAGLTAPDADVQFLTQLQGIVVGRMRAGQSAPHPGGAPQQGQPQPQPQGPPQGQSGPPGQLQGMPGPNGVQSLAAAPNPDELRRMIASQGGAGGSQ